MTYGTYISKTRHNAYQFRIIIPSELRDHFNGQREIRRSLRTDSRYAAIIRARFMWVEFQKVFADMKRKKRTKTKHEGLSTGLITSLDFFGREVKFDYDGDVEKENKAFQLHNAELIKLQRENPDLALTNGVTTPPHPEQNLRTARFKEVAKSFLAALPREKKLTAQTVNGYKASFDIFSLILGNKNFNEITKSDINKCREQIYNLPKNRKGKTYKDSEIAELLSNDNNDTDTLKNNITRTTAKTYLQHLKLLCKYAFEQECHHANLMVDIKLISNSSPDKKRLPFNEEDLKKLFSGHIYKEDKQARKTKLHIHHFWLPLLALYTGARLEELCQLTKNDLIFDKNNKIYFLDISDIEENKTNIKKSLKNENSRRRIPLHKVLIMLGFVDFVDSTEKTFLFNLEPNSRGKRGSSFSNWFNRSETRSGEKLKDDKTAPDRASQGYILKCGVEKYGQGWSKVFHSFRHTFIDNLRQNGVDTGHIAALAGHEPEHKVTHSYGNDYNLNILLNAVNKLDFELDFKILNFEKFLERL
jgi:integrase